MGRIDSSGPIESVKTGPLLEPNTGGALFQTRNCPAGAATTFEPKSATIALSFLFYVLPRLASSNAMLHLIANAFATELSPSRTAHPETFET
jgi:hypothetical protein